MNDEIKRMVELTLCETLVLAVALDFHPSKGGTAEEDATLPEPPFCIVAIDRAEKVMATEGTWQLSGMLVYVTELVDEPAPGHSAKVREIYNALVAIRAGGEDVERSLRVHGIDIGETSDFTDEGRRCHGDTIRFTSGATA